MQYIKHNFFENWHNANKYNDFPLMQDILQDEIAKVIVFDLNEASKAVLDSGLSLPKKVTGKNIAEIISGNISKNKKLRSNVVSLIFKNNKKREINDYNFNGNGRYKKGKIATKKQALNGKIKDKMHKDIDSSIYLSINNEEGVKNISSKIDAHKENKKMADQSKKEDKKFNIRKPVVVYLSLLALGLVSVYVFNRYFSKEDGVEEVVANETETFEKGGELNNVQAQEGVNLEQPLQNPVNEPEWVSDARNVLGNEFPESGYQQM